MIENFHLSLFNIYTQRRKKIENVHPTPQLLYKRVTKSVLILQMCQQIYLQQ